MTRDSTPFKKACIIDSAELDKLDVVLDPTETDLQHVLLKTASRQEFADWVATRPSLPVGINDPEVAAGVVSEYTMEIYNAVVGPEVIVDGGDAVPGGQ